LLQKDMMTHAALGYMARIANSILQIRIVNAILRRQRNILRLCGVTVAHYLPADISKWIARKASNCSLDIEQ
jgi:hypothetical protein